MGPAESVDEAFPATHWVAQFEGSPAGRFARPRSRPPTSPRNADGAVCP